MLRLPLFAVLVALATGCATDPSAPPATNDVASVPCVRSTQLPSPAPTAVDTRSCDGIAAAAGEAPPVTPAIPPDFVPNLSLFRGWSIF